jgi:hypothetical protein
MFAVRSQTDRNREREPLHACSAEVGCGHARLGSLTRLRRSSPLSVGNPKQPYDSHCVNQKRQDGIRPQTTEPRKPHDDTANVYGGQHQAEPRQPAVRRARGRQRRFHRYQICHQEQTHPACC